MRKCSFFLLLGLASVLSAADPAQLQLARDVFIATQGDKNFDRLTAQITQQSAQALNLTSVSLTPAQRDAAVKVQEQIIALLTENNKASVEKLVAIYAEVYTEPELKALKTFFESTEGKAFFEKLPQVGQRMQPAQQAMMAELMPKLKKMIEDGRAAQTAAAPAPAAPAGAPVFTLPSNKP